MFASPFKSKKSQPRKSKRQNTRKLLTESLERRELMTASPFSPFMEASVLPITSDARNIALASSGSGRSVVVWEMGDGNSANVVATMFAEDGAIEPFPGNLSAIHQVAATNAHEYQPDIAMDQAGNFVVVWTVRGGNSSDDVRAQFYDANGNVIKNIFVADSARDETDARVSIDDVGRVIVTYRLLDASGKWTDEAKMYSTIGDQQGQLQLSPSASTESSDIAMTGDGRFAIAYSESDGGIRLQRSLPGDQLLAWQQIAGGNSSHPSVAMDQTGNGVVVWREQTSGGNSVWARRFTENGTLGVVEQIAANVFADTLPSVTITNNGEDYLVTFEMVNGAGTDANFVRVQRVGGTDVAAASQLLANNAVSPVASVSDLDEFSVSYISKGATEDGIALKRNDFDFQIDFNFIDTEFDWSTAEGQRFQQLLRSAADRWESVISGDLPNRAVGGIFVDDIRIDVWWDMLPAGTNGTTKIVDFARATLLPALSEIRFNSSPAGRFDDDNKFLNTATHEIGHALGFAKSHFDLKKLSSESDDDATNNGLFRYLGQHGRDAYDEILGAADFSSQPLGVPLEDTGGPGSVLSHWRESILDYELMTSSANESADGAIYLVPLSKLSVGVMEDLGYVVNTTGWDDYVMPAGTTIKSTAIDGRFAVEVELESHPDPEGQPGTTNFVEVRRNGQSIELWVNSTLEYSELSSRISQLQIRGTAQSDIVTIFEGVDVPVDVQGAAGEDQLLVHGIYGNGDVLYTYQDSIVLNGVEFSFADTEGLLVLLNSGQSESHIIDYPEVAGFHIVGGDQSDLFYVHTTAEPNGEVRFSALQGSDSLQGPAMDNLWRINKDTNADNGYDLGMLNASVAFTNFEHLIGNSLSDTFTFASSVNLPAEVRGTIDAGGGNDILDYSQDNRAANVRMINSNTLSVSNVSGYVSGIESLNGSPYHDTFTGPDENRNWGINRIDHSILFLPTYKFYINEVENLVGGSGNDYFQIAPKRTLSGVIDTGPGQDKIQVVSHNINDQLLIHGDDIVLNNRSIRFENLEQLQIDLVSGVTTTTIAEFPNVEKFTLNGSSAEDAVFIEALARPGLETRLNGMRGNDTLYGSNVAHTNWILTGAGTGYVLDGSFSYSFNTFENLVGNSGKDAFSYYAEANMSGRVDGGAGKNTINYSHYNQGVEVDLLAGTATGTGSLANFRRVVGSNFDDFIRGNDQNNYLSGHSGGNDIILGMGGDDNIEARGGGRHILVGGDGADVISDGFGQSILIGGSTDYDRFAEADSYFGEFRRIWTSPDMNYTQRVATIRDGVYVQAFPLTDPVIATLDATTVHGDGRQDRLTGDDGLDWFFGELGDVIDQEEGEEFDLI